MFNHNQLLTLGLSWQNETLYRANYKFPYYLQSKIKVTKKRYYLQSWEHLSSSVVDTNVKRDVRKQQKIEPKVKESFFSSQKWQNTWKMEHLLLQWRKLIKKNSSDHSKRKLNTLWRRVWCWNVSMKIVQAFHLYVRVLTHVCRMDLNEGP